MFTGIIEHSGTLVSLTRKTNAALLTVALNKVMPGLRLGESVAVNGVCLTVTAKAKKNVTFDLMKETLECSALGMLKAGDRVNLERALTPETRISGHFVTGHVDGVGTVIKRKERANFLELTIRIPSKLKRYLVSKGSVCCDGVSLTVGAVGRNSFNVSLIPLTAKWTTLGQIHPGDRVNIETDILAKYMDGLRRSK